LKTKPTDTLLSVELVEGVAIQLRPAGFLPRAIAILIDVILMGIISAVLNILVWVSLGNVIGAEYATAASLIIGFLMNWFYFVGFEISRMQATPGKHWMKLKVVRVSGAPVGFGASFLRSSLRAAEWGLIGIISMFVTRYSQWLGDLAAGTVVVYKDQPSQELTLNDEVKSVMPSLALSRKEQVAFLEFAQRYGKLSAARRAELVKPLASLFPDVEGEALVQKALGVAKWLELREG